MPGRWQPLTRADYLAIASPAFHAVFRTGDVIVQPWRVGADQSGYPDPYGEPFQPELCHRGLLASISINLPTNALLSLANAARDLGEHTIFRCYTEARTSGYHDSELGHPFHWRYDLQGGSDFSEITDIDDYWPLENAFYGRSGMFGILCSQGDHAVIGSSSLTFIREFYAAINTTPEREVRVFLRRILVDRDGTARTESVPLWVPRLLAHVLGQEVAEELLASKRSRD